MTTFPVSYLEVQGKEKLSNMKGPKLYISFQKICQHFKHGDYFFHYFSD